MDKQVKAHLERISARDEWGDTALIDILREYKYDNLVHKEHLCNSRWWSEWFYVVDVEGMLIGYEGAIASGDKSVYERGYLFDEGSICRVRAREVVTTVYEALPLLEDKCLSTNTAVKPARKFLRSSKATRTPS